MNSHQIEIILNKFLGNSFIGVYGLNYLNRLRKLKENESLIIFTCVVPTTKICHFVAVYNLRNYIYYFDSLGESFKNFQNIQKYLSSHKKPIKENKIVFQSPLSILCGLFAIVSLVMINKYKSEKNFQKIFIKNPLYLIENDSLLKKVFKYYKEKLIKG